MKIERVDVYVSFFYYVFFFIFRLHKLQAVGTFSGDSFTRLSFLSDWLLSRTVGSQSFIHRSCNQKHLIYSHFISAEKKEILVDFYPHQ